MRESEMYTRRAEWHRQVEDLTTALHAEAEAWVVHVAEAREVPAGVVWAALTEIGRDAYDTAHARFVYGETA